MTNYTNQLFNKISNQFFVIAGPCIIECEDESIQIAKKIKSICDKLGILYIFKGSYRKANRTNIESFTGIGDQKAIDILIRIKRDVGVPVLTDMHSVSDINKYAKFIDIIQIPAFLSRQTDILMSAGDTNKIVNIKKGQFLSANNISYAINKVKHSGNSKIIVTERGVMFGYQDLVVDFRNIPIMRSFGYPVVLDATHSLQKPNQDIGVTGGDPKMIETIASAGAASGIDGVFIETHANPDKAKSDGANMLKLEKLEKLLTKLVKIKRAII